jgi:hypothetical protein
MTIFSVADEFHGKYALESLFSALCEINPGKHRYANLMEIVSLNPSVFMFSFGFKVLIKVDVIDCQQFFQAYLLPVP